ncbi:MAG: hypothetical protein MJ002_07360 [Paludibacteraceae bacterium]|nr:hypothetical protein [Paludibacteraceae bacterium]
MEKIHTSPEFEVIELNQANAKFFVASFSPTDPDGGKDPNDGQGAGFTGASYDEDEQNFTI